MGTLKGGRAPQRRAASLRQVGRMDNLRARNAKEAALPRPRKRGSDVVVSGSEHVLTGVNFVGQIAGFSATVGQLAGSTFEPLQINGQNVEEFFSQSGNQFAFDMSNDERVFGADTVRISIDGFAPFTLDWQGANYSGIVDGSLAFMVSIADTPTNVLIEPV